MLQRLADHIRACYERSAIAEKRAANADHACKAHHLHMARWWAHLARSYEFTERLERFLLEADSSATAARDQENKRKIWRSVSSAPYDRDLRLAVLDEHGVAHALVFPCRRVSGGWVKSGTKSRLQIDPTHWHEWIEAD